MTLLALAKAALKHIDLTQASPLQHHTQCNFWKDLLPVGAPKCNCPCFEVVKTLQDLIVVMEND